MRPFSGGRDQSGSTAGRWTVVLVLVALLAAVAFLLVTDDEAPPGADRDPGPTPSPSTTGSATPPVTPSPSTPASSPPPTRTPVTTTSAAAVPPGTWGGDHLRLVVTGSGATAEFDCANGTVDEPLVRRPDGSFDAPGRYFADQGGPARTDDPEPVGVPARYRGRVDGAVMTLTVQLPESDTTHGPYRLRQGSQGSPQQCL